MKYYYTRYSYHVRKRSTLYIVVEQTNWATYVEGMVTVKPVFTECEIYSADNF